jgi:hypothetical protein
MITDSARIFFALSGANDPRFNLRREPSYIIRQNGKNQTFVNVLEIHGNYDGINEFSTNAYSSVRQIKLLKNDLEYTVVSIFINGKELMIAQCNADFQTGKPHRLSLNGRSNEWNGPYAVWYNGQKIAKQN